MFWILKLIFLHFFFTGGFSGLGDGADFDHIGAGKNDYGSIGV